jgi:beta-glucosidase
MNADSIGMDEPIQVSVKLTNTGQRAGKEVVQLYSRDRVASIVPAVKQLRRFEKINLEPGESKVLNFELSASDLAFVNAENEWVTEAGDFTIQVDTLKTNFYLKQNEIY